MKSLYNFKNLLQIKRQINGNYYKMRHMYLSFLASFNTPQLPVFSFFFVINFLNCKETSWTPCIIL